MLEDREAALQAFQACLQAGQASLQGEALQQGPGDAQAL